MQKRTKLMIVEIMQCSVHFLKTFNEDKSCKLFWKAKSEFKLYKSQLYGHLHLLNKHAGKQHMFKKMQEEFERRSVKSNKQPQMKTPAENKLKLAQNVSGSFGLIQQCEFNINKFASLKKR